MVRAKTAKPIEIAFGMWTPGSPGNHMLGEDPGPSIERGTFWREKCNTWPCSDLSSVDIFNLICKEVAAMRPLATSMVTACCRHL